MARSTAALFFVAIVAITTSAQAIPIQLDFQVDLDRFVTLGSTSDPGINFDYTMVIDTKVLTSSTGSCCDGGVFANTTFSSLLAPPTPVSADVLSHTSQALSPLNSVAQLYRESSPTTNGATFELFALLSAASSPVLIPTINVWTSYQRGIQNQRIIAPDNEVTLFTEESIVDYLKSFVGSSLPFEDGFIVSEFFPALNTSNTTDMYYYFGQAELISVSEALPPLTVPSPSTASLLLLGLLILVPPLYRRVVR